VAIYHVITDCPLMQLSQEISSKRPKDKIVKKKARILKEVPPDLFTQN
jgi:hypothetical protein